ncbi:MAG: hypothetical protein IPL55_14660 [Saprospiraceae bacterium]|jgi:uncharacterized membrane protein|nr:hypothetical protein [Saprospiraceae bacterium]MBL0026290.1 hypothetical protein [Saprospiraceae bacterium]
MNTNKILVAGLIGGVFSFFFGWLIYGILLADMMPENVPDLNRAEADMIWWAVIVSNLLYGILFAYVFVQWASISTWMGGAKAGAILGFLITASYDTGLFAFTKMHTMQSMIMDIVVGTIFAAIVGAVIGWWLGRK